MHKQGEKFQKKQDDKEQYHRNRAKKSRESPESPEKQPAGHLPNNETPFLPRMKEHADILSGMHFAAQRNNFLRQLHLTYGSRYVQRLLASMNVQAQLTISKPDDVYEQEAERVADVVTRALNSPVQRVDMTEEGELLQGKSEVRRAVPEEEEELLQAQSKTMRAAPEEEEELQMQPDTEQAAVMSKDIEMHINSARGGGQPLADNIKKPMEQAFGADFSGVRTHTDSEADRLNKQLSARAFTTGKDIFFREGEYSPGSASGQHIIAHELTHVVQQSGGRLNRDLKALQMDKVTVQRDWEPTAGDLALLNSMHPSALDFYKPSDYLRYSGLYNMLEEFAKSEYTEENIHFLKDLEEYGESPEQAENIWDRYLMKGAPEAINISGSVWTKLRLAYGIIRRRAKTDFEKRTGESGAEMRCGVCNELVLDSAHVPERARFNAAKEEITKLVVDNTLARFKEKARGYTRA